MHLFYIASLYVLSLYKAMDLNISIVLKEISDFHVFNMCLLHIICIQFLLALFIIDNEINSWTVEYFSLYSFGSLSLLLYGS